MPRKPCYWTRKYELELVEFIKARPFIWKPFGNTNHQIQRKYKAYAEFAAKLGSGFTARSVRDRWVNIRSTFNHNVRRIEKSHSEASSKTELFVPCWPLWLPLQFLRKSSVQDNVVMEPVTNTTLPQANQDNGFNSNADIDNALSPRNLHKSRHHRKGKKIQRKCKQVLNQLILSMKCLKEKYNNQEQAYWFFGKHVTQKLNSMSSINADSAANCILSYLQNN